MKGRSLSATLAAFAYGIFCALGIAVMYTLLFVALPKGATPWSTLQDLLVVHRMPSYLWAHPAATVAAGGLALALLFKPPREIAHHLWFVVASAALATFVWVFLTPRAGLPTFAVFVLTWGYIRARRAAYR